MANHLHGLFSKLLAALAQRERLNAGIVLAFLIKASSVVKGLSTARSRRSAELHSSAHAGPSVGVMQADGRSAKISDRISNSESTTEYAKSFE